MFYPYLMLPMDYDIPPTLYRIMNSLANFDVEDKTKIRDLAKNTHSQIFDFDYPLSNKMDKEEFECLILNKFIRRRIGFETMTSFKLALEVKLNEIMPMYNKMFDMLDGWDLFRDGEVITTISNETGNSSTQNDMTTRNDNRYASTPQGHLQEVEDGTYMSDYTLTQGSSNATAKGNDERNKNETITRTPSDKIKIYKEFIENKKSIMTMIFEELECLFFGLV